MNMLQIRSYVQHGTIYSSRGMKYDRMMLEEPCLNNGVLRCITSEDVSLILFSLGYTLVFLYNLPSFLSLVGHCLNAP